MDRRATSTASWPRSTAGFGSACAGRAELLGTLLVLALVLARH